MSINRLFFLFNEPFPTLWPAIIVGRLLGRLNAKNLLVYYHATPSLPRPLLMIYRFIRRIVFHNVRGITSSRSLAASLSKSGVEISTVAPLWVSELKHGTKRNGDDLVLPEKYALFFCRLVPYKGTRLLLEIINKCPNVTFVVAGKGKDEKYLKATLSDRANVHLLFNDISECEKATLFRSCHLFLFPSINSSEAFGITQLEAMEYGKPICNFEIGTGVNEVCVNGFSGLTCRNEDVDEFAKNINRLWYDDKLSARLGSNGYSRVTENYREHHFRDGLNKLFKGV